ncbi:hypothetical protein A9Q99_22130 [Gammaproteobacteria bacterium 45_16_T64]|nr:hypothetical protein A9Q99_22130 [Gammaproteobacteria bacterium 45_16_T64]
MTLATTSIGALAAICYAIATYILVTGIRSGELNSRAAKIAGFSGVILHGISVYLTLFTHSGLQLGIITSMSLIAWTVIAIGTSNTLFRDVEALLAPAYPLAALLVILSLIFTDTTPPISDLSKGMAAHILFSIIAYSIIALALCQAIFVWIQNYQLKHRHIHDILHLMPPLQSMENSLFDLISTGLLLLTAAIFTGFMYVDDIFAQHLVHKTIFTLASWSVFALLIVGKYQWGWRGMVAVKWTLTGFSLLLLGFFGSKFVMERILTS